MVFVIVVSVYAVLIIVLAFGFARLEEIPEKKDGKLHTVTVIVAVRNEASTIPSLLSDLSKLNYPPDKWEVIVVDDHSADKLALPGVRVIPSPHPGKKSAITAGVAAAKGEIIVTTDADCRVQPGWLHEINKGFQEQETQMIVGAVRIDPDQRFFSQLQSIEFVSVIATGAATLGLGVPTMCNGANLAYRKDAFIQVNGYQGNENIASGDDEFLMNKFNSKWRNSIAFLYSKTSVVSTSASPDLSTFIQQRLRWAGKWKHNISLGTRVFAMVVWLFHLSFLAMPFVAAAGFLPWRLFFILAGAKIFVESLFLIPAANVFNVKWRWISFLVLQFFYSFYVVSIGLMSQVLLPVWKGRAVESKV
ncbi:MAG TPA: glycosyltransferase [Cyclobacteriaceae bacterium]|nr:glycosyltransferase [Cyclobacteriaceae bacterium]